MSVKTVTKENFQSEVIESAGTVLLDFWAAWCGPCRMMSPVIDEIADENPGITVGKVNVDEQPELAEKFNVTAIPTLAVIKQGKVVFCKAGFRPKEEVLELLK